MSLYVRELLQDSAVGLITDTALMDINVGLKKLLSRGDVSLLQLKVLYSYLAGYSISEIELDVANAKDLLVSLLGKLEHEIKYHDEHIIKMGLDRFPKYQKIAPALRRQMVKMSSVFEEGA